MCNKGDKILVTQLRGAISPSFYDSLAHELRPMKVGDVLTVIYDEPNYVVYMCESLICCLPSKTFSDAQALAKSLFTYEILTPAGPKIDRCTCTSRALLMSGCSCGYLKKKSYVLFA